jgi:phage tail protein X
MKIKTVTLSDGRRAYSTLEGDMVDDIAFRVYGEHANNTQLLYEANYNLAFLGPVLPEGVLIIIPPAPPRQKTGHIRLFD